MIKRQIFYIDHVKKKYGKLLFYGGWNHDQEMSSKTENISYINDKYFDGDMELDLFSDRAMLEKCAPLIAQKLVN